MAKRTPIETKKQRTTATWIKEIAVSYTHLDVYKRQRLPGALESLLSAADLPKRSMASFIIPAR